MKVEIISKSLGRICDVRDGTHDSPKYVENGFYLLTSKNFSSGKISYEGANKISIEDYNAINKRSKVDIGDIVMPMIGTIGSPVIISQEPNFAIKNVALIKSNQNICMNYICAFLASSFFERAIKSSKRGGTQKFVSLGDIRNLQIPLPPIAEQKRIAVILDRTQSLISKRKEAIAKLDTLTQSIFIEMFGDTETNPHGWDIQAISNYVAQFQGGKSIESESGENTITKNRILKVSAVTKMVFLPEESKPLSDDYEPAPEHFVRNGDLLFSRANTTELVGAVAYVKETPSNILLPDKLWRFVWKQPAKVLPLFVWSLFQTSVMRREIGKRATGTSGSMKNISQEKLLGIKTIVPPLPLQKEFAQRVEAVEKLKATHRASLSELQALFASLQHRAFRGEL